MVYTIQGLSFCEYQKLFHAIKVPVFSMDDVEIRRWKCPNCPTHPLPPICFLQKTPE